MHPNESWWTRTYVKLNRVWQKPGQTILHRALLRDRAALRASIATVLEWDFERVTVSHGEIVETGGRKAIRSAFARN